MKPQEHRIEDLQRRRFEADLETTIAALFRRCPTLCGFSVRSAHVVEDGLPLQHATALFVTDVSDYPWSGLLAPAELHHEIVMALAELADTSPGACELLRERSFARVFQ